MKLCPPEVSASGTLEAPAALWFWDSSAYVQEKRQRSVLSGSGAIF